MTEVRPLLLVLVAVFLPACTLILHQIDPREDADVDIVTDAGIDADLDHASDADEDEDEDADADADADATSDADVEGDVDDVDADEDARSDWFDPVWEYRRTIAFHPTRIVGDVSDFPVAIVIERDDGLDGHAREDGGDILFTDAENLLLPFEIERFNPVDGTLVAWVRVPVIEAAGDSFVYMYYSAPDAVAHDPTETWADRFAGVWHLSVEPPSRAVSCPDSTSNGSDAAPPFDPSAPVGVEGVAGWGLQFDGFDDSLDIDEAAPEVLDFGEESFSFSLWVFVTMTVGDFDMPWYKGGGWPGNRGYDVELGRDTWEALVVGNESCSARFGDVSEFLDRWVYLAVVVDRVEGTVCAFPDGIREHCGTVNGLGSTSTEQSARISHHDHLFRGLIDEVRVYAGALTEDWIALEHENLTEPGTFLDVGDEEPY